MPLFLLFMMFVVTGVNAVQLYIDDEKDLNVYLHRMPATNIANNTNLLLLDKLKTDGLTFVPASYKRALRAMRSSKDAVCVSNRIKTPERLNEFLFSLPVNIYLSRRLYLHASAPPLQSKLLNEQGEVKSLPLLFNYNRDALVVLAPSMSYGPFLDKQLLNVPQQNKVLRDGTNHYDMTYFMFKRKRADFLLGYPAEIFRHNQNEREPTKFRVYDIEGAPKYVLGHWMCNNNEQSAAFIKRLDTLLKALHQQDSFYQAHLRWLPQTAQEKTRTYLDTLFRKTH